VERVIALGLGIPSEVPQGGRSAWLVSLRTTEPIPGSRAAAGASPRRSQNADIDRASDAGLGASLACFPRDPTDVGGQGIDHGAPTGHLLNPPAIRFPQPQADTPQDQEGQRS
jgi:hypothetical protein